MPFVRSLYPADWEAISYRIRFVRAGSRCECSGQCGDIHPGGRCDAEHERAHPLTGARVILTTAHYPDRDPQNCADDNLLAMCQRCQLRTDRHANAHARRYGRAAGGEHQARLNI